MRKLPPIASPARSPMSASSHSGEHRLFSGALRVCTMVMGTESSVTWSKVMDSQCLGSSKRFAGLYEDHLVCCVQQAKTS